MQGKSPKLYNPTLLQRNVIFPGSEPEASTRKLTLSRNNVGLESLGFFPCMAKGETHAQQCAFPVKPRYLSYL